MFLFYFVIINLIIHKPFIPQASVFITIATEILEISRIELSNFRELEKQAKRSPCGL